MEANLGCRKPKWRLLFVPQLRQVQNPGSLYVDTRMWRFPNSINLKFAILHGGNDSPVVGCFVSGLLSSVPTEALDCGPITGDNRVVVVVEVCLIDCC